MNVNAIQVYILHSGLELKILLLKKKISRVAWFSINVALKTQSARVAMFLMVTCRVTVQRTNN